nr:hypothetical protein [Dehalococcoidales bacterium]
MADKETTVEGGKLNRYLKRRQFLGIVAAAGAGIIAAGCQSAAAPSPTSAPAAQPTKESGGAAQPTQAPAQSGAAKPLAGVTLNGALFQHPYSDEIKKLTPEF